VSECNRLFETPLMWHIVISSIKSLLKCPEVLCQMSSKMNESDDGKVEIGLN